jgi:hypothetical protein
MEENEITHFEGLEDHLVLTPNSDLGQAFGGSLGQTDERNDLSHAKTSSLKSNLGNHKNMIANSGRKTSPTSSAPGAMENYKTHDSAKSAGPQLVPVRFEFTDAKATSVCVAGTFNHWQPESKTSHSTSTGRWWKEIALAPGTYEYCLLVDGQWMPAPLARETVPNPFGGRNSVLKVANSPEATHLADAENLPMKNEKK